MTILPPDICLSLRDAGLPQPGPEFGQIWYLENQTRFVVPDGITKNGFAQIPNKVFCPDAEYLLGHLPFGCVLYRTQEGYAIKHNYHQMNFNTYPGESLAHAAALAFLHLQEKTPAPLP